ncbi:MAG: hypothetical protein V3S82_05930 [Dehalococcoidia bacterium]
MDTNRTQETWQAVEEKETELRRLMEEAWSNGEWEKAISGERTLKVVEQSRKAVELLYSRVA